MPRCIQWALSVRGCKEFHQCVGRGRQGNCRPKDVEQTCCKGKERALEKD